jgi:peptidoglycan/LPS O-acetylase OafA/YrhL
VGLAVLARSLNLSAFILITHLDGLVLGGLLAGLLGEQERTADHRRRLDWRFRILGLCSAVLFLGATAVPKIQSIVWPGLVPAVAVYMFKPLFINLAFFALVGTVVLHAGEPLLHWLRDRRLVYLGSISYGIYLYHHFIFEICHYYQIFYGIHGNMLLDVVKVMASLGLAALSWRYVERPILALKDRFSYREVAPSNLEFGRAADAVQAVRAV